MRSRVAAFVACLTASAAITGAEACGTVPDSRSFVHVGVRDGGTGGDQVDGSAIGGRTGAGAVTGSGGGSSGGGAGASSGGGPGSGGTGAGGVSVTDSGADGMAAGGAVGAGGSPSTGGTATTGGVSNAGGTTNSGGTGTGATSNSGGNMNTGGMTGSGGLSGTGGATGSGGSTGDGTAIGTLGNPCSPNGAYACAGHAQRGQLVCSGGSWATNGTCTSGNNCDTSPANAGFCSPIAAECTGKQAGDSVCKGTVHETCGLDLVTVNVIETCPYVCTAGACSGVCIPNSRKCVGTTGTQTCGANGQWGATTACPYSNSGFSFSVPCSSSYLYYATTCSAGTCVSHASDPNQNCWYCCSASGTGCSKVNAAGCP